MRDTLGFGAPMVFVLVSMRSLPHNLTQLLHSSTARFGCPPSVSFDSSKALTKASNIPPKTSLAATSEGNCIAKRTAQTRLF